MLQFVRVSFVTFCLGLCVIKPALSADLVYSTREGDTLWDLCLAFTHKKGCWIELGKYNGVVNDRAIPIGTEIKIPVPWLKQQPVIASVSAVSGTAQYQQLGRPEPSTLIAGQEVHLGSVITTGEGTATLLFNGSHKVLIRPQSRVEVIRVSNDQARPLIELALKHGELEADVDANVRQGGVSTRSGYKTLTGRNSKVRFLINTPAAIAAVRGTEFRIHASDDEQVAMRGEVTEGLVAFEAQQQVEEVPEGFGIAARQGQPLSAPKKLLPAPQLQGDLQTLSNPVIMNWAEVTGAVSYQLDLFAEDQVTLIHSQQTVATEQPLPELEIGCYLLKLRATDAEGFSGLDSKPEICVVDRLNTPQIDKRVQLLQGGWRLRWQPVKHADKYRIEFSPAADFSSISEVQEVTGTEIFMKASTPHQYFRVTAVNSQGISSLPSEAMALSGYWQDVVVVSVFGLLTVLAF